MKQFAIFLSIFVLLFTACSTEAIEPEFKRLEKIEVTELTKTSVTITTDAILYNPNPVSIFLTKIEVDIFANDVEVTHISQTQETEIVKKDEFPIPLAVSFNPKDIFKDNLMGLVQSGIDMFKEQKIDVRYEGYVEVRVFDTEFEIPIDMEDEILLEETE